MSLRSKICEVNKKPLLPFKSMIDQDFTDSLLGKFKKVSKRHHEDCLTLECDVSEISALLLHLRDEETFDLMVDLTAIDHGESAETRFSVVMHFYSRIHRDYIRIHSLCIDNSSPSFPSVSDIFPAANWHEREAYDMFGITFENHPNLKRILMWDEYPHYPLRKDFPLAGIETPLPADDVAEVTNASVDPAPMMGGPFVSSTDGTMSDAEPRAKDESWTEDMEKPQ